MSQPPRARRLAERRTRRQRIGCVVAADHDGVASRGLLRKAGLTDDDIREEIEAGRWYRLGRHTIGITQRATTGRSAWWWAVWEAGPGAVLDGVTALQAAGLTGWQEGRLFVCVPGHNRVHELEGVVLHRPRRTPPTAGAGVPRLRPEVAAIRAAEWAASDRQAATILAMTVQQRLVPGQRLLAEWEAALRSSRRELLEVVIRDICAGAQSLGELDFAALCRERGLPEPTRQVLRKGPRGRVYLDVFWEDLRVHVEIDGVQHGRGLAPVDDALRQNAVHLDGNVSLRIPVLGLRLFADRFMDQVAMALGHAQRRRASG